MPEKIKDYDIYTTRMAQSIWDKTYFMDKISPKTSIIVDYGCADGAMIRYLAPLFPNITFIGYDKDPMMVQRAMESMGNLEHIMFFDDWEIVDGYLVEHKNDCKALVLSSVIHEIYSYLPSQTIEEFWDMINYNDYDWDYVCIRDMMVSIAADRVADPLDVVKVCQSGNWNLNDFQANCGSIESNKNLIHYLLKYKYEENWEREVKENYLPISVEEFYTKFDSILFTPIYKEHYVLPYTAAQVKKDFDITIKDPTHIKLIMEHKKV